MDVEGVLSGLHELLRRRVDLDRPRFESRWDRTEAEFRRWLNGLPGQISPLTRDLFLLQLACEAFEDPSLRSDPQVQRLVLAGAAGVGEDLQALPGGPRYRVLRRQVTADFQIWYEVEDEHGRVTTHVFVE